MQIEDVFLWNTKGSKEMAKKNPLFLDFFKTGIFSKMLPWRRHPCRWVGDRLSFSSFIYYYFSEVRLKVVNGFCKAVKVFSSVVEVTATKRHPAVLRDVRKVSFLQTKALNEFVLS